ncbi:MAG: ATP-binding cassette domain-containing protein [Proteobacteria bacterium]|nr:ATP-binding cassette domain-containing protein [Pseudomonadota bacterium]
METLPRHRATRRVRAARVILARETAIVHSFDGRPLSEQKTPSHTSQRPGAARLDQTTRTLVKRLFREYVRPLMARIVAALLCMVVVAVSTAAFTQIIKPIVDDVFMNRQEEMLLPLALVAFAVFTAKGFAAYGQAVLMSYVGLRIVADMQRNLYERVIGADLAFFNRTSPGELIARFINDINLLRNSISNTLVGLGKDSLTTLALVGVLFYEDWRLALIAVAVFPTAIFPIVRIGRRMRKVSDRTQAQVGQLTTLLDETFQGVRYVKAYAMEAYENVRAGRAIEAVFGLHYKGARTRSALHPIMEVLGGLAIVAVILYGGSQVIAGTKAPGSFFAFITALLLAYEPVKRLARLNANLQEGLAAAVRVFALLDREPEIRDAPQAAPLKVEGGAITFQNVTFSYDAAGSHDAGSHDAVSPALHRIDLEIPAGKTVALVGPSGAGKSTIMNLIPRLYDVDEGRVTIDGQDLRAVTLASLRAQIALVSQEILLFDDTIRANIAYGRPGASEAEIAAAAATAGADDFIAELPQGLDTPVGVRGESLSGGQRQRIAIARATLKNAPILLLDEATSSLDSESERQVQQALAQLMAGRTTLVIAHRLSTVINADIIYVIEAGRMVESGTHAELLRRAGTYARLYALQFAQEVAQEVAQEETAVAVENPRARASAGSGT